MSAFDWTSPLGASVSMFIAAGAFQLLIAVLTSGYVAIGGGGDALLFTERSDTGAFGNPPAEMIAKEPGLNDYRRVVWIMLAAFLAAVGILQIAIAWFGLRAGAPWALTVLALVAVVLAVFWATIVAIYLRRGAHLTLADVPPFMWIPAALAVPASILGWLGLRG